MAGNRTIIGSESSDDRHIELDKSAQNLKITLPVTIYDGNGNQVNLASGLVPNAYNSMELSYDGNGNLTGVVYKLSGVIVAILTLEYNGSNVLTKVTKT